MRKFTTLNNIITDLLEIVRGGEVARTEPISKTQMESWVHQYRSILIKQGLDKDRLINPDYVQIMTSLTLAPAGVGEYSTIIELPNTIFRNFEDGFTWIGNLQGVEYQYMTQQRSTWSKYRKYTSEEPYVYLRSNKVFSNKSEPIEIRGIFENPMEVIRAINPTAGMDFPYPIPADLIPTLKEMILKGELGMLIQSPSDDTNDSTHNVK